MIWQSWPFTHRQDIIYLPRNNTLKAAIMVNPAKCIQTLLGGKLYTYVHHWYETVWGVEIWAKHGMMLKVLHSRQVTNLESRQVTNQVCRDIRCTNYLNFKWTDHLNALKGSLNWNMRTTTIPNDAATCYINVSHFHDFLSPKSFLLPWSQILSPQKCSCTKSTLHIIC